MSARSTVRTARRLSLTAVVLFTVLSSLLALGLAVAIAVVVLAHSNVVRYAGVGAAVGAIVSWLVALLLCSGAQAIAEHIELHATATDRS